jgi:serine protease AprX
VNRCPFCGGELSPELRTQADRLHPTIQRLIRAERPDWSKGEGICPSCLLRYARRFAGARSQESVHTQSFPHASFPYYHPQEASVLPLYERLPDYPTFTGQGITIGFLDSGYYPHPDLIAGERLTVDLTHSNADVGRTRRLLEKEPLRIRHYLNLFEGREYAGLDAPSLWSDAPNSWHGQMTSVIAAGNGLLSEGRYRGFAPKAELLPIKIGLPEGGIPEAEILRGLQWLLREGHYAPYNVRVVNVSVGGDAPQAWWQNEVCQAVEELARRGVVVIAAAGNANRHELLAPAQAPSAITIGGIDDGNRRWRLDQPKDIEWLQLYHHNWGEVYVDSLRIAKPELVAIACWVPAPVLPVSGIFREMGVLGQAWQALEDGKLDEVRQILWEWESLLGFEPAIQRAGEETLGRALRLRMNPHKFAHGHYQHVDGTSVAAPQVSAVAAQMLEANPALDPYKIKEILIGSALPLAHLPAEKVGAGLLQPATAVALALRAPGGPLQRLPISATPIQEKSLHELGIPVKVAGRQGEIAGTIPYYFGVLAPDARSVSLTGTFNDWQPEELSLFKAQNGWWHGIFLLPAGEHLYRFWIADPISGNIQWIHDPENPIRQESGYLEPHSVLAVAG